ncbi:MAG: hypothetical protein E7Z91_00895 [Cyanobacteria bacterium SIG30]|nr:hypothetical protein [Cyanobacteria bacterium SIG30]
MKIKRYLLIALILIFCLIFLGFTIVPSKSYKVIKIVEGDKFYIDLNENKIAEKEELFHLKGVNAFPLHYSAKTKFYAKKFGITTTDVLELGYFGKKFSEKLLLEKQIRFIGKPEEYNPEYNYRFAEISLNGIDYSIILLQSGFGFSYWKDSGIYYKQYENIEKIKENAKRADEFQIKVLDNKNKIYHNLDCKDAFYIKDISFIEEYNIEKNLFEKCEKCKEKNNNKDYFEKENIESAKADKISKNFELFLINPNKYKRPSNRCRTNVCQNLLFNIRNAKESIDFAIYGIEKQDEIINELKKAKEKGIKIRGVTDSTPQGKFIYSNTEDLEKLFDLKSDNKHHFMHNKFFIFDNKKVLTGSINLSSTGTGGYNSNSAIIIENKELAKAYTKEFEEMYNGLFQNKKLNDNSITNIQINKDINIDVYFSPKGKTYEKVFLPLIKNAKKKIYIDIFYLTHKGITQNLIEAHKRGVEIKIIIDSTASTNQKVKLNELRQAGINVKVENWGGKAHEKTISIDDYYLILGSANFSNSGMNHNDENLIVIRNSEIAKFYNEFFITLYNSIDDIYLTKIPKAESYMSKNSCFDGIDNDFDGYIDLKDKDCEWSKAY